MRNEIEVKAGSVTNATDKINVGFPRFISCDHDGDSPNGEFHTYKWVLSPSLKIKIFGIKVIYRPTKWAEIQLQLPSRTQFRKLSGRRKRLVGKSIERYIISKGASNGNSSE